MKTCPQCGFHHTELDERCIRCGSYLATVSRPDPEGLPREKFNFAGGERPHLRWSLPSRLRAALRRRFYFILRLLESDLPTGIDHRNPWTAAFLSLLPGLGQLYNHQPKKACLLFLFVAACLGLAIATMYQPFSNYVLFGYLLAMVYSFHDGLVTAKKINRHYLPWQHMVAFYCAWLFYVWSFCLAFQYVASHFLIQFRYLPYAELSPYLNKGERFTIALPSTPRLGDVVYCQPPALTIERTPSGESVKTPMGEMYDVESDWYVIHPTSMIERIVAEPGQTFSRRDGIFYRDGRPVSPAEQPLVAGNIPANFSITCPPDSFVILFSYTFGQGIFNTPDRFLDPKPEMQGKNMIITNFNEACIVKKKDVIGKPWFVYQPPTARRILK